MLSRIVQVGRHCRPLRVALSPSVAPQDQLLVSCSCSIPLLTTSVIYHNLRIIVNKNIHETLAIDLKGWAWRTYWNNFDRWIQSIWEFINWMNWGQVGGIYWGWHCRSPWAALPPYPVHSTGEIPNVFDSTTKTIPKPTMLPLETKIHDQKNHIT
jgi:hypothetical protein